MAEALVLLPTVMALLRKIPEAVQGAVYLKGTLRERYCDYASILEPLESNPDAVIAKGITPELRRLNELFSQVVELLGKFTASPGDRKATKMKIVAERLARHADVVQELDTIDAEVIRNLSMMSTKGAIKTRGLEALRALDLRLELLAGELAKLQPRTWQGGSPAHGLPRAPEGAPDIPHGYVERKPLLRGVVDGLTSQAWTRVTHALVGSGGSGKTCLASAVVRDERVQGHFHGGIRWVPVGKNYERQLPALLRDLVIELGIATSGDARESDVDSDDLVVLLSTAAADISSRRLVVLDDVWEPGVVDVVGRSGFSVLVTSRDPSVMGISSEHLEVGRMAPDEALRVLAETSRSEHPADTDQGRSMLKVVEGCGFVPLALAVAGSVRISGVAPRFPGWDELQTMLQNARGSASIDACPEWVGGGAYEYVDAALGVSFAQLSKLRKQRFLMLGVTAKGSPLPLELLRSLWDYPDLEGARGLARQLVSKQLLHEANGEYLVNNLVLDFASTRLRQLDDVAKLAASRLARYLGKLELVHKLCPLGLSGRGFYDLDRMWRAVEDLSINPRIRFDAYRASLGMLERGSAGRRGLCYFLWLAGRVCELEGTAGEAVAEGLYRQAIEAGKSSADPHDPRVCAALHNVGYFLKERGNHGEAVELLEEVLARRTAALGVDHIDTVSSRVLMDAARSEQALASAQVPAS